MVGYMVCHEIRKAGNSYRSVTGYAHVIRLLGLYAVDTAYTHGE